MTSLMLKVRPVDEARSRLKEKLKDVQFKADQLHEVINTLTNKPVADASIVLVEENKLRFMNQYSKVSQQLEVCLNQLLLISEVLTASEDNENGFLEVITENDHSDPQEDSYNEEKKHRNSISRKRKSIEEELPIKHPNKGVECEQCGKKLHSTYALNSHMSSFHSASADLPHVCSLCPPDKPKRYARKDRLKEHMQTVHLKQFNYRCGKCNKGFQRPSLCNKHEITCVDKNIDTPISSEPKEAFICQLCPPETYFSEEGYKAHMEEAHSTDIHQSCVIFVETLTSMGVKEGDQKQSDHVVSLPKNGDHDVTIVDDTSEDTTDNIEHCLAKD